MPPVTLTAASAATAVDLPCAIPATALAPVTQPVAPTNDPACAPDATATPDRANRVAAHVGLRPQLRLVATGGEPGEIVHGRGGPSSCSCRECAMARHPASFPRLTVVR
ncbi:hypothetical protein [Frankia sp. Cppng1_Ct_nod]|uniref:hypothetical protein n=1 Tax=Frankia sp. Cppng1_Ct_nod TaxID=2897162 RepID=UPI001040E5B8|nr:hypothetical protein [Frankia sp. Cppng1_Ct_nod]